MSEKPIVCPDCGRPLDPVNEEVDIGVGVQTFLVAYECFEHGGICGVCFGCGVPHLDGFEHRSWCPETKKTTCAECRGKGRDFDGTPCDVCGGEGKIPE